MHLANVKSVPNIWIISPNIRGDSSRPTPRVHTHKDINMVIPSNICLSPSGFFSFFSQIMIRNSNPPTPNIYRSERSPMQCMRLCKREREN